MKEFQALAFNVILAPQDDGRLEAIAELVTVYTEPAYARDEDGEMQRRRQVGQFRVLYSAQCLRHLSTRARQYADTLDAALAAYTPQPVPAPPTDDWKPVAA